MNEIGFVPAWRSSVRFTDSVHSSQSSLFIDFNDQNLWAEMETETARAKSSCKTKTHCSRVGVLQTHHQIGDYLMFHTAKHKPHPLTSTSNTRYLQTE